MRCFRPSGEESFEQINVYSADNGGCKQRESDGNFEKNWCGSDPGATQYSHWLPACLPMSVLIAFKCRVNPQDVLER